MYMEVRDNKKFVERENSSYILHTSTPAASVLTPSRSSTLGSKGTKSELTGPVVVKGQGRSPGLKNCKDYNFTELSFQS